MPINTEHHNTVAVIDGGGRGSALVDAYAKSEHVSRVLAFPGNDTMGWNNHGKEVVSYSSRDGRPIKTTSVPEIVDICREQGVRFVDVAQDNAVEAGLVDALQANGILTVGPTRAAGQIEWDKGWAREFGERHDFPQPGFKICLSAQEGMDYGETLPEDADSWVKAIGLAEGKGAMHARGRVELLRRIREVQRFGNAFVIEQGIAGEDDFAEEFSMFGFAAGGEVRLAGVAQDHKRIFNFDEGENTGGMGVSTPPLLMTPDFMGRVQQGILEKAVAGLSSENRPYNGVIYLGGMAVRKQGELSPSVVEFNARWGDPEVQGVLPGMLNDLFEVSLAIAQGDISKLKIQTDGKSRVVVAGASRGYPGNVDAVRGKQIYGLEDAMRVDGAKVYGAGIKVQDGKNYAAGGRQFYVVGEGNNVIDARQRAYQAMSLVHVDGNNLHFRTDIGYRDVQRLRGQ